MAGEKKVKMTEEERRMLIRSLGLRELEKIHKMRKRRKQLQEWAKNDKNWATAHFNDGWREALEWVLREVEFYAGTE